MESGILSFVLVNIPSFDEGDVVVAGVSGEA